MIRIQSMRPLELHVETAIVFAASHFSNKLARIMNDKSCPQCHRPPDPISVQQVDRVPREYIVSVRWPRHGEGDSEKTITHNDMLVGERLQNKLCAMVDELFDNMPAGHLPPQCFYLLQMPGGIDWSVLTMCDITGAQLRFMRAYDIVKNSWITGIDIAVKY